MSTRTRAHVKVTIEVELDGSWDDGWLVGRVHEEMRERAVGAVRRGLVIRSMTTGVDQKTPARIVGEPEVTLILLNPGDP